MAVRSLLVQTFQILVNFGDGKNVAVLVLNVEHVGAMRHFQTVEHALLDQRGLEAQAGRVTLGPCFSTTVSPGITGVSSGMISQFGLSAAKTSLAGRPAKPYSGR